MIFYILDGKELSPIQFTHPYHSLHKRFAFAYYRLYQSKKNTCAIARELGVPQSTFYHWIREAKRVGLVPQQ